MRRGHLYTEAQKRGCNKIALGHHYDDAIETVLMGIIYGCLLYTSRLFLFKLVAETHGIVIPLGAREHGLGQLGIFAAQGACGELCTAVHLFAVGDGLGQHLSLIHI